jgi:hypothetical protein
MHSRTEDCHKSSLLDFLKHFCEQENNLLLSPKFPAY